jgi:hypothetical protein
LHAQTSTTPGALAAASAPTRLPVRRVVLYKNGIGYFEHLGRVTGTQTLSIEFNTSQLNDVLKSLTTVDLGSGHIADISFNSDAPLARRLGAFALPTGDRPTLVDLLTALRGTRLEIRAGGRVITGRLFGIERRQGKDDATWRDEVTLVSDRGEVHSIALTPATAVRLAERESADRVSGYLGLLASTRAQDRRTMTISAIGEGNRDVMVGYISEVPVWKTTYRIVLPPGGRGAPVLHGWAIVDNTIGEDWNGVELSLVAGAPQSFVQPVSQPIYAQRPVVAASRTAMPAVQIHGETGAEVRVTPPPPPPASTPPPVRVAGNLAQSTISGMAGGTAGGGVVADRAAVEERLVTMQAGAAGQNVGDLFEYHVDGPITIRKNQSALVPIVTTGVGVERVSLWNERIGGSRPLRSVWLTNTSGLTLDGGSFAVLEDATFAGEGLVDPMRPGEKRLLSFGVDLGVQVESKNGDEQQQVSRIRIDRGIAVVRREQRSRKVYTIRNNEASGRTVVVEHPIRSGWTLAGSVEPVESSITAYRFAVNVGGKDTATLIVDERHPIEAQVTLAQFDDRQFGLLFHDTRDDPRVKQALGPIAAKYAEAALLAAELEKRRHDAQRLADDQQRLRENMRTLKGSTGERQLLKRYVAQLEDQEDRIAAARREADALEGRIGAARLELAALIERLSLELDIDEP